MFEMMIYMAGVIVMAAAFAIRKPTNPEVIGFAITLFKNELQFWKKR